MRTSLSKILPGTLLAATMLVSAVAWSGGPHPGMGPGFGDGRMLMHLADKLELSDTQRGEIRTLVSASRDSGKADFERMREIDKSLRDMRTAFNADEARKLSTELGEISARVAYRMAETNAGVYAVLTPEQQAELDAMAAKRPERGERKGPPPPSSEAE
ncbi:Spy/CpxP family protein refolding chaperone [Haliea sp. E17]|uniref:Spy/CpxP family protein refolding chaperone n=1 Tax=Haliea sp. E17 TaxID=3401576 RepID=UPI003AACA31D